MGQQKVKRIQHLSERTIFLKKGFCAVLFCLIALFGGRGEVAGQSSDFFTASISTNARAETATPNNPGFDPCIDVASSCTGLTAISRIGTGGLQTDGGFVQGDFTKPESGALTFSMFGVILSSTNPEGPNQGGDGSWWGQTLSPIPLGDDLSDGTFSPSTSLDVLSSGTAVVNPTGSGFPGPTVGIAGIKFNIDPIYIRAPSTALDYSIGQTTFVGGLSGTSAEPIGGVSNPGNEVQTVLFDFNWNIPGSNSTDPNFNLNGSGPTINDQITQGDSFTLTRTNTTFGVNTGSVAILRTPLPTGQSQTAGTSNCAPGPTDTENGVGITGDCVTLP